jgi:hypothetical protein
MHNIPESWASTILMHNKLPIQRCIRQSIKCTLPDFFPQSYGLRLPSWHQHTAALPSLGSQEVGQHHHPPLFTLWRS